MRSYAVWVPGNSGPEIDVVEAEGPDGALVISSDYWAGNLEWKAEEVPGLVWTYDEVAVFDVSSPEGVSRLAGSLRAWGEGLEIVRVERFWPDALGPMPGGGLP